MPSVVVVYHSGFGHTKVLAEAVQRGAASVQGVTAQLFSVGEIPGPVDRKVSGPQWDALNAADAIVFGAPTYMGDVSAEFRKFAEATGGIWFTQGWKDKLAGGFTNSGSPSGDKLHALHSLSVLAAQHGMIWVGTGQMPDGNQPENINRLGSFTGAMAQSDNASPEVTPPAGDRRTAEAYGKRIAEAAVRWARGKQG